MGAYGLLGRSLSHSYSPAIHRLLGSWPYSLYQREPEELKDFLLHGSWDGINVTIPYKKAVVPYCRELSPLAQKLGSVNTLVRRADGSLYGDNTDYFGFQQLALSLDVDYGGKKALVLGSGGASVTVQAVLQELGCHVTVISRNGPHNYGNLDRHRDAAILVNATPVGMFPHNDAAPVSLASFPRLEAVLDLIYNPARTRLLLEAERLGIAHRGGLLMLVSQAARSSELFTGQTISREKAEAVERSIARSMENLILIGMPGCGKTTVGAALARATGKRFWDADRKAEKVIGMTIPRLFQQKGEAAFRACETAVLEQLGKQSALVLATGGGCVTREENLPLLRQNGRVIWLRRALDKLPTEGRPLSRHAGVQALYDARASLYRHFSDFEVSNDGSVEETVNEILEAISQ